MGLTHNVVAIEEGLRLTCHIQTLQVEPGLFAFHRSFSMRGEQGLGIFAHSEVWPANKEHHGFVDQSNLDLLLRHEPFETLDLAVLSCEEIERARFEYLDTFLDAPQLTRQPLPWLCANPWTPENVVKVEEWHLYDRHGSPLPSLMVFDHIESRIDDTTHHLPTLYSLLRDHPDFQILHKDVQHCEKMARTYEEALHTIVEDDPSLPPRHTLQFVWNPSAEDYRRVWQHASGKRNLPAYYPFLFEAFMELDVAGLSAAQRTV